MWVCLHHRFSNGSNMNTINNTRGTRTVVRVVVKAGNLMKEKMKGKSIFYTPHMIGLPVGQSYQDTFFSSSWKT